MSELTPSYNYLLYLFRYITARAPPPVDEQQDIESTSAMHENGVTTMNFRRPRVGRDLSLDECRFFIYGWGGSANSDQSIGYHPSTPIVSSERICLPSPAQCPDDTDTDKGSGVDTDKPTVDTVEPTVDTDKEGVGADKEGVDKDRDGK